MALRRLRLELARPAEFPEGNAHRGYEFIAPLTDDGHLDEAKWRTERDASDACTVHRFRAGEDVSISEHDGVPRTFRLIEVVPVL